MNFLSLIFRYKEKKSPDKLGLYPRDVHVAAFPERRYLWTARTLVILASLSLTFTIVLASTLFLLIPSRGVIPKLLNVDASGNELKPLKPMIANVGFGDLLIEKHIIEYIKLRHEIEEATSDLFDRWAKESRFYWLSGEDNFSAFSSSVDEDKIITLIQQDIRRIVNIMSVEKISHGLWVAKFETKTTNQYSPHVKTENWRAYLKIRYIFANRKKKEAEAEWRSNNYLVNPFGIKIDEYNLSYAGSNENSATAMETANALSQKIEN